MCWVSATGSVGGVAAVGTRTCEKLLGALRAALLLAEALGAARQQLLAAGLARRIAAAAAAVAGCLLLLLALELRLGDADRAGRQPASAWLAHRAHRSSLNRWIVLRGCSTS
eukprot:TRINITY_DN1550_c0_g1_i6.p1 TRINITY_DN1550_c0_g1~~TRINITY_DN1550_c0_g1_i6.p1  ORF type:complete len:112 (-),score=15.42 TRINITY_DN1550_c0_g1_i6:246-581(-)